MKSIRFINVLVAVVLHIQCFAQTPFLVGSSKVSIEPPEELFSVSLAGYGAPREGRFSLTWNYVGETPGFTTVTSYQDKIFGVHDDGLYVATLSNERLAWRILSSAEGIVSLADVAGQLYAVKNDDKLYKLQISGDRVITKRVGVAKGMRSITGLGKDLYGIDKKGAFYKTALNGSLVNWEVVGEGCGCDKSFKVKQLTSDNEKLYAINANDTVYMATPSSKLNWRIIGRYNSYTFKINIHNILVVNKRLYAFDNENRIFKAAHQSKGDMIAQALAIKNEDKTVLIVGADVAGFDYYFVQKFKQLVSNKTKIPAEAILVNAAHNHFAPVSHYAWRTWQCFYQKPNSQYLNNILLKGMLNAVDEALANMNPSEIDFLRGETNIGINRRSMFYLEAPYDGTLDVLAVKSGNDIKDLLFVAGCHPVFNNVEKNSTFTLTANYPGAARETIQYSLKNVNPFFVQGCGGDINPASDNYETTGKDLGTDVLKILQESKPEKLSGPISYSLDMIKIPIRQMTLGEVKNFKALNEKGIEIEKKYTKPYTPEGQFQLTELMEREKNVRWAEMMLEKFKTHSVENFLPLYIQTINIGNWKIVGLSREVTTEYAQAIRNLWPDKLVTVAAYCNDVNSYLPNRWHIMHKTYEGYDSFFWYGRPGIPYPTIFNTVLDGLKQKRDNGSIK